MDNICHYRYIRVLKYTHTLWLPHADPIAVEERSDRVLLVVHKKNGKTELFSLNLLLGKVH
jgi:hypothetical protein